MTKRRIGRVSLPTIAAIVLAGGGMATAQGTFGREITLSVDLTDAPRKLIHATETMAVVPGPLTLVYPKWIPGEHGPTGPIEDQAGFVVVGRGADGKPCGAAGGDGRVAWARDTVEMYAFHLTVPDGCATLEMRMDFLATAAESGFSAGASTSANLAVLSWNTVVVSRAGVSPAEVRVRPTLTMPSAWQYGTALRGGVLTSVGGTNQIAFDAVSLETLVDSPVLAGKYFKEIALAPEVTPKHFLDMAADGPEDLELPPERVAEFSRLVREAGALYKSRHYGEYHFLVTLSDSVAHFGLEHHESSDDRAAAKTFVEDDRFVLAGDLLPHEFTHSWNGKYRRPAGLATGNYEKPMEGDLLWVYEGLTQYLGDVLVARSGLWTPEQYRGMLALHAALLDNEPGRMWRNLQDTATMAQVLYGAGGGWDSWRRGTDFYDEGELVWLDVDTTIRTMTDGKKSLNDFVGAFEGLGGDTPPKVVPYTFADVVAGLNAVVANDWGGFLRTRLDSHGPHAPLGGIEKGGWKLTYAPRPNPWSEMTDAQAATVEFWFSLGMHVNNGGGVTDVLKGGPADKAGLGPGMRVVAVNGRGYTPALLRTAVHETADAGPAVDLIVENAGFYRVVTLDYHGGERYPVLERVTAMPDRLGEILKPMVPVR